jgi:biotin-[acetyl-CoA-carboxylase] ligase BirA-like protein
MNFGDPAVWRNFTLAVSRIPAFAQHRCLFRAQTGSTNDDVKRDWHTFPPSPTIIIAGQQEHGRGQFGRTWVDGGTPAAFEGMPSLLFSFSWHLAAAEIPRLALTIPVGTALFQAIVRQGGNPRDFWLKWPNDLVSRQGKLGGVLVEATSFPAGTAFVIGIGINLTTTVSEQFPQLGAASITSLGVPPSPTSILCSFLQEWDRLCSPYDEQLIRREFLAAAAPFLRNRLLCRRHGQGEPEEVAIEDLDENGGLWVRSGNGTRFQILDPRDFGPVPPKAP